MLVDAESDDRTCEVPLIEQLRDVPKDYRTVRAIQWSDDGRETGHQFIPVGFMMHRAATELESQAAEIKRLKEDAEIRRNSIEMVMDARNELSDVINTWNGMGINDDRLYKALDTILDMLDNAGLRRSDAAK